MRTIIILFLLQVPIISKYLSYQEVTKSVSAEHLNIANVPTQAQLFLIQTFGREYFDSLRIKAKGPLYVSSLFRSPALNKKIGGAGESEHMILDGVVACDIDQDGRGKIGNRALFFLIKDETTYRKLIWEFGTPKSPAWVHVSWSPDPSKNVKRAYRATRINNRIVYQKFNLYE